MTTASTSVAISAGLIGASRLARGDRDGMRGMETTPLGAARSFWVAAICLPFFLILRFVDADSEVATLRGVTAELIGYAVSWVLFPLFARHLAAGFGREALWPRYVAAWNWCNVVHYVLLLVLAMPALFGASEGLTALLSIAVLAYGIWLSWFVARTAFAIHGSAAAGFVLLDLALSLVIARVVMTLGVG